jgi:WD40 repeat protein
MQISVRHAKMIKDYGVIFENIVVQSIATTPDNKYLFAGSFEGHLKQISRESQRVVHDYGKIHKSWIPRLETTRDIKWLITVSEDNHVKRISVENRQVDKDIGRV